MPYRTPLHSMSTYVEISVPVSEMALAETVDRLSAASCYVEQSAMGSPDRTVTLWISCDDRTAIPAALEADSAVKEFERLREQGDETLYEITLERSLLLVRDLVHQHDGTVRSAYSDGGEWTLEVRFPSRESLSAMHDAFENYEVEATFESIQSSDPVGESETGLTDGQRKLLETAIELGYFDIPRSATLEDIGEELDVTHQALSERLRRAQQKLATERIEKRSTLRTGTQS